MNVRLHLEDGTSFAAQAVTDIVSAGGEIVFNTSMTGYQEICTDPSYTGQMVVMTYPHIGNVGVNEEDVESNRPWVSALITRSYHGTPSNWRSTEALHTYLAKNKIPLLTGVDTRRLVRHLRDKGAMRAVILHDTASSAEIQKAFSTVPNMNGQDLATQVSCKEPYEWAEPLYENRTQPKAPATHHIVVIDFGAKYNILRHLVSRGCKVTVVPSTTTAAQIADLKPDGIMLSNGPGDPAAVTHAPALIQQLMGKYPMFGICLGHQLLALSLGATTYKLKFGHRGANQPVKNLVTGKVTITSQNHGFAVDPKTLPKDCIETEINLNDNTNQGFRHTTLPIIAVQYHPEASPGPHDANYWFDEFMRLVHAQTH
ncbi:MAG: carbamoyl phosphate synthase small subunit [Deltaproteobacteria bacterium CG11_big_fil_rev_8_21_14_0_20_47_16]|nr:MAG: carbamoyl phosphate synthase small subunit [Deltaproteobacteria bacterium CG11_big_fil_rev_8_21_14_0_20_47_16]